jgi:hypothetical protein
VIDGDPALQTLLDSVLLSLAREDVLDLGERVRASGPSSRPRPDCLKPPNGVE